jgi:hypothetical protein
MKQKRHCRVRRKLGNLKVMDECESALVKNRNSKRMKEIIRERQAERRQNDVNNMKHGVKKNELSRQRL